MLRWKDIKDAVENSPVMKVTDDTRLTYVIVHGRHVGFGVVESSKNMSSFDFFNGYLSEPKAGEVKHDSTTTMATHAKTMPTRRKFFSRLAQVLICVPAAICGGKMIPGGRRVYRLEASWNAIQNRFTDTGIEYRLLRSVQRSLAMDRRIRENSENLTRVLTSLSAESVFCSPDESLRAWVRARVPLP